ELPRPEFYGTTLRKSPFTLKNEIHFPFHQRIQKLAVSGMVVFVSLGITIITIGVLIVLPLILPQVGVWTSIITACVNLITILILNMIYTRIALWLTNFENHKTSTQFEDMKKAKGVVNALSQIMEIPATSPVKAPFLDKCRKINFNYKN
ncbi:1574_t:CDS:2, partial [Scutellospora calospora]